MMLQIDKSSTGTMGHQAITAALKAQINKTDRNDARGISQMMQLSAC